uniref:Uncharacterized protein n=1 Tax=Mesocestoides corti TaxID=53468 RepID=A0A5K3FHB5_MESCO
MPTCRGLVQHPTHQPRSQECSSLCLVVISYFIRRTHTKVNIVTSQLAAQRRTAFHLPRFSLLMAQFSTCAQVETTQNQDRLPNKIAELSCDDDDDDGDDDATGDA